MKIDETNTLEAVDAYYIELIDELRKNFLEDKRDVFLKELNKILKEWKLALDNIDD